MDYKVVWTPNAEEDLRLILDFLMDEWADNFAKIFSEQIFKTLNLLEKHPYLGVVTYEFSSIRRIAITRKYGLYYTVLRKEIIVLNLLSNKKTKD